MFFLRILFFSSKQKIKKVLETALDQAFSGF